MAASTHFPPSAACHGNLRLFADSAMPQPPVPLAELSPVGAKRNAILPLSSLLPCPPHADKEAMAPFQAWLNAEVTSPPKKGIARLAARSPRAAQKRGVEYFSLEVKSVVNHCDSDRVPFDWTINPYRGCEFACRYCYARYTHEFMDLDSHSFENKIFVKQNTGHLVSIDLDRRSKLFQSCASDPRPSAHIAIGTATDPYQPAEREFGATRAMLEQFSQREGLNLSITTKSNQILRDIDLLKHIASHSTLTINITITTLRPRLARLLEPRAPRPDLRLQAVRALNEAGLRVGVFAMPVIPGITDRPADLENLAHAASEAGAQWLAAGALFLMPAAYREFLPFIEERFPKLAAGYRRWYARNAYAPEPYRKKISARFAELREKYSLSSRPLVPERNAQSQSTEAPQLSLALAPAV
ncbi:MAG: radical SAM protein [Acidobacteria bacterium]|nr:radical SAM protein [Acidobacteriota bacterium]